MTVDEAYIRNSILNPLDDIVDTYPSSMPPGIGTQLGDRKVEAMVGFIMRLEETAPEGKLLETTREELTKDSEAPEGE